MPEMMLYRGKNQDSQATFSKGGGAPTPPLEDKLVDPLQLSAERALGVPMVGTVQMDGDGPSGDPSGPKGPAPKVKAPEVKASPPESKAPALKEPSGLESKEETKKDEEPEGKPPLDTVEGLRAIDEKEAAGISMARARAILHGPLQQSWNVTKHTLLPTKKKGPLVVMDKLLEFRKQHHKQILVKTAKAIEEKTGDKAGLDPEKSSGKGTESRTSDIDVNLKGTQTELAVPLFNKLFKADGWNYESGVVYDVNVYATDFMHSIKGVDKGGKKLVKKEGARKGKEEGGLTSKAAKDADAVDQSEWAQVKLRLYMNLSGWQAYKRGVDPTNLKAATWARIEARYDAYQKSLKAEMARSAGAKLEEARAVETTGAKQLKAAATRLAGKKGEVGAENLQMEASNRIYEKQLEAVAALRKVIEADVAKFNAAVTKAGRDVIEPRIEKNMRILRSQLSACSLYANEAYVTDGAVNHAVVGLQVGTPIQQTKGESANAVTENMADTLKEIGRHGKTVGEAAFKAGKYMWRLADAAKNMGAGNIRGVNAMFDVGARITNVIKGSNTGTEEADSAKYLKDKVGISSVAGLQGWVTGVGTAVTRRFNTLMIEKQHDLGGAVDKAAGKPDQKA